MEIAKVVCKCGNEYETKIRIEVRGTNPTIFIEKGNDSCSNCGRFYYKKEQRKQYKRTIIMR